MHSICWLCLISVMEVCRKARAAILNYNLVNKPQLAFKDPQPPGMNCRNTGWSPPAKGDLKLNTDAHLLADGRWSLGFILHREDGDPVVVATKEILSTENSINAETHGVFEASSFFGLQIVIYPL